MVNEGAVPTRSSDEAGEILPDLGAGILASGVLVWEVLEHIEVGLFEDFPSFTLAA
jgi:hypothetical protein